MGMIKTLSPSLEESEFYLSNEYQCEIMLCCFQCCMWKNLMNQKTILRTEQLCWKKGLGSLCMQLTCRISSS